MKSSSRMIKSRGRSSSARLHSCANSSAKACSRASSACSARNVIDALIADGGSYPSQRQEGHVVGLLGAADKAADVVEDRRNDALGIDDRRLSQRYGQPFRGIERVVGVLRLGDPVGVEQQDLARLDPVVIDR